MSLIKSEAEVVLPARLPDQAGACLPASTVFRIRGSGAWRLPGQAAGDLRTSKSKTGAVWDVDFKPCGVWGLFKKQLGKYL